MKRRKRRKEEQIINDINSLDLIEECFGLSSGERGKRCVLQNGLLNIYIEKEGTLIQKCKVHWLKEGDENTKFFHRYLAAWKRKALISELKNDSGISLFNQSRTT